MRRISDFLPSSEKSNFIRSDPLHSEMLVGISEVMGKEPDLSFNRALSKLPITLYSEIVSGGLKFSEVSASVQDYLGEFPEVVDYLSHLIKIERIDTRGYILTTDIPSFKTFLQKFSNPEG